VDNDVDTSLDLELTCVENEHMEDDNVIFLREEVDHTSFTLTDIGVAMIYALALGRRLKRRRIMSWILPWSQQPRRMAM